MTVGPCSAPLASTNVCHQPMSFLHRLVQPFVPWPPPGPINTWPPIGGTFRPELAGRLFSVPGGDPVYAVGEKQYQEARRQLSGGTPRDHDYAEHSAFFVPEPDNPKDANAIRVCMVRRGQGAVVGCLSREDARAYRPAIDRLAARRQLLSCLALFTNHRGQFGLSLHLASPAALALALDVAEGHGPDGAALVGDRIYASTRCPYCSAPLDPLPDRTKRCPSCGKTIHVVTDPLDGSRLLLTTVDADIAKALIEADRVKQLNQDAARDSKVELREAIELGWTAVEVQAESSGGALCAACEALAGRKYPIRMAPKIPPAGCVCPGGCDCSYDPTD